MSSDFLDRAVDKIARLSCDAEDLVPFWQACTEVLEATVPHYWTPCWYTLDPGSLLITSHFHYGLPEFPAERLAHEYYEEGVNQLADVVRSPGGISTLYEVTNGEPQDTRRWQLNMQMGGDQELILALRTRSGDAWGALGLYREPDQELFNTTEKSFLRSIGPYLAQGARRSLLLGEAREPEGTDSPGVVVLDEHLRVQSMTPGMEQLLSDMPDGDSSSGRLPSALLAVAGRAIRGADPDFEASEAAVSRVLSRSGRWLVLHGASLGLAGQVAVIVEPAPRDRIYPLLMAAYGLTDRERDVTRLILQGNSTTEIAEAMVVSPQTVQQHLKSIFDKTGVRSRRDLVGKVFFAHYEPRFRDNERRALEQRPVRGGPMPATR